MRSRSGRQNRGIVIALILLCALMLNACTSAANPAASTGATGAESPADLPSAEATTEAMSSGESGESAGTTGTPGATETTGANGEPSGEPKRRAVRFAALGDNLIHPNLYGYADAAAGVEGDGQYDFTVFFEHVLPLMADAELRFINQETISGGDELGLSGYPQFNSPRALIYQIEAMGFNLVNIANNHVLDMGVRGIYHALYHWNRTRVTYAGAYADEEDRAMIRVREVDGVRFALLSYTSHTNGIPADAPWRIPYMVEDEVRRDVAAAKQMADFVIVSAHWGWDDAFPIDEFQRNFARIFAESGVDLVVGTGPHLLQHIEWLDRPDGSKMLCAFSLGNYASGMLGPFNELTGLLRATFVIDGDQRSIEQVEMIPLVMHKEVGDKTMGVYLLSDYTDEMAARSAVNHYRGGLNLPYLHQILREQIAPEFLPEEFRGQ